MRRPEHTLMPLARPALLLRLGLPDLPLAFALMAGCASTYTKITEGPNGKAVEELTYEPKWWANLDRPDWMDVVERQSYVPGQAPVHETCDVEPTQPTVLRCLRK